MKQCVSCKAMFSPSTRQIKCDPCRTKPRTCEHCKSHFLPKRLSAPDRFCSLKCKYAWINSGGNCQKTCSQCGVSYLGNSRRIACDPCQIQMLTRICKQCGISFQSSSPNSKEMFCSRSCGGRHTLSNPEFKKRFYTKERDRKIQASRKKTFSEHPEVYEAMCKKQQETMTRYMNSLTPEQRLEKRKNQSRVLREMGHKPPVRGGNGTGPTSAEMKLMELVPDAIWNYPVKTGMKNGSGYPTCYKLDVAIPSLKFGVEADGHSHNAIERAQKDVKKVQFLSGIGWTVLRFTNKRILKDAEGVRQELMSIIFRLKGIQAIP